MGQGKDQKTLMQCDQMTEINERNLRQDLGNNPKRAIRGNGTNKILINID
jgi:hypothetical protein